KGNILPFAIKTYTYRFLPDLPTVLSRPSTQKHGPLQLTMPAPVDKKRNSIHNKSHGTFGSPPQKRRTTRIIAFFSPIKKPLRLVFIRISYVIPCHAHHNRRQAGFDRDTILVIA